MSAPDEPLRTRLRVLAEHEPLPSLSASQRVQAEQAAEAAVPLRAPTGGRWLALSFSLSLLLSSVVFWLVFTDAPRATPAVERAVAPVPARVASAPTPCQAFAGRALTGAGQLELGTRAAFSAAQAGRVSVSLSDDCDVTAELSAGTVFVHAKNLEGHALRVLTPHGQVEVRGTVFAVHTERDVFVVEVDEGHVEVRATDGRTLSLLAGEAVRVSASAMPRKLATLASRNLMRLSLGLSPRAGKALAPARDAGRPALSADEPGDTIWQLGSVPAPSIPPEPGTSVREDGRPMHKPQVTTGD